MKSDVYMRMSLGYRCLEIHLCMSVTVPGTTDVYIEVAVVRIVTCNSYTKRPPMTVAHENIRLAFSETLAEVLSSQTVDDRTKMVLQVKT